MEQDTKQDIITNTMTDKTKKNNRGLIVGMSICAILAIGGIGFGTYGMIQSSQKDNQISDLKEDELVRRVLDYWGLGEEDWLKGVM